ncbi:PAS-domain containing protein [Rhodoferax sp. PAMC 29310]|uniref:PAS-domain containing protein n=1 Tax=Rhodoferax sp. PAMC 29310 TaxID=2822760 RepID=UPI001B334707|nr:PAS-domain containing protein [Rhodoferax sp. PAMC 29310]
MSSGGRFSPSLVAGDAMGMYQAMLDHLPVGVVLFDRDLRVIAINQRLIDLLMLPQIMFEHGLPTLGDITRFNASRGEYGPGDPDQQTRDRLEQAHNGLAHRYERIRPNGQALEIIGSPLPQGGFITIYNDITESYRAKQALSEQALYLSSVVEHLPQGISVFDEHHRLKVWNANLLEMLQIPAASLSPDTTLDALLSHLNPDPSDDAQRQALQFQPHRFERLRRNGRTHLVEGRPMVSGERTVGFVTSYTDITEQKASQEEFRQQNILFQTLVDNVPGGVTLFGPQLELLAYNQEFARLLELPAELLAHKTPLESFFRFGAARGEFGSGDIETVVERLMTRARQHKAHKTKRTRPNGSILDIRGTPLPDGCFVTIYTDVTEQHHNAAAIERLAHSDILTGLANRYALEARLDQLVSNARRNKQQLTVMLLDLDNFKSINDTKGHGMGDQFLCEVAQRLSTAARADDIVARLGGDEFVIILADMPCSQETSDIAARIMLALNQPVTIGKNLLRASASMGICFYPQDGADRGALMQSADIAMYHAKKSGKGMFHFFNADMMRAAEHRLAMEHALREAVQQKQFVLHFQPQIDALGKQVSGVEALIRWVSPSGELTPPEEFIALAEEIGLINEIGEWVLNNACQTLARWRQKGLPDLTMAVNLSAIQLRNADLPQIIVNALKENDLPANALTLEITESVAMQDPLASIQRLGVIRDLGVQLAMDDFGTGYSSLAYLKRLPLDYLKLDRTFVQDLETDSNDATICMASIGLAHDLGLMVVAEGVETRGQHYYLANLGCNVYQGYYYSRPMPEAQAYDWIRARFDKLLESQALLTTSADPRN